MNASPSDPVPQQPAPGFHSRDCINVIVDLQGDNTVRPIPPERLPAARAARERIERWEEWRKQQDAAKTPPKESESGNGSS